MSKNIISLEREHMGKKRSRCPSCEELMDELYVITDKKWDGSIFALTMCYTCLKLRMFRGTINK